MKILELFSGYGTASFALKRLVEQGIIDNYECVGYSDIDKYANQCFKQNHCTDDVEDKLRLGDVRLINPNELEDFDLLTGGFPCQAFSVAGKGLGELDPRGTLFYEIIRIAEVKKPKYMLLENVKGLTNKNHKKTFEKILSELTRIGYKVHWKILNTKDYGIPQNRERVWFVCFREQSDYDKFKFPEKEELKILIKDILEENRNDMPIKNKKLKLILDSPTGKEDPCFELKGDTPSGLSRQKDRIYSKISPCLNCTIEEVLVNINGKIIKLNGKEHFRLQGFLKDNINIYGFNQRVIKKLAGNGQSVNVVEKIFKEMFKGELNSPSNSRAINSDTQLLNV